jgi:hypothetical protein
VRDTVARVLVAAERPMRARDIYAAAEGLAGYLRDQSGGPAGVYARMSDRIAVLRERDSLAKGGGVRQRGRAGKLDRAVVDRRGKMSGNCYGKNDGASPALEEAVLAPR